MEDKKPIAALVPNPRCPECGYSREGLELLQVCPECGWQPRANEIILWGYGHGNRATPHNARRSNLIGPLIVTNIGAISVLINPQLIRSQFWWPLVAFFFGINVWIFARRRVRIKELGLPEVARLTPEGCGQRTGVGKLKLKSWRKVKDVTVGNDGKGLVVKCHQPFLSIITPVEINLGNVEIDQLELQKQLSLWHSNG